MIVTTPQYSTDFLIEKQEIWKGFIPFSSFQKDQPWHKVILHGIPISDFNNPEGMQMIIDEIRTFNKNLDLNPIGTPY